MAVVSGSTKHPPSGEGSSASRAQIPVDPDRLVAGASGSTATDALPSPSASLSMSASAIGGLPDTPWAQLFDALIGDVVLQHSPGRRTLDIGHGCPEVSDWVRDRAGPDLSVVPRRDVDRDETPALIALPEAGFDLIYCLRTFPHLGRDEDSSTRRSQNLLEQSARLCADGGILLLQAANLQSLRGFSTGIRSPMTIVSRRRRALGDRHGLTHWDTLGGLKRRLPSCFEVVGVHGLGVAVLHARTLELPIIGNLLARAEWWLRDHPFFAGFGAQLLVVLRRIPRNETTV